MVNVTLQNQRIREVHFLNHIEQAGKIQLGSNFNFKVNYSQDNTKCMATLYQSMQMKDDPDTLFISAEIVGNFVIQGIVDEETKKDAHIMCYDQLFPFLQSTITQITSASGLNGLVMRKQAMNRDSITFAKKAPGTENPPMTLPIV